MLWWIIPVAILGFLVVLLAVPLGLVVRFATEKPHIRFSFRWLFGLAKWEVVPKKAIRPKAERVKRRAKRGLRFVEVIGIMETPGLVRRFFKFLRKVFHHLRAKRLGVDLRFGLGDPAATGIIFGLLAPPLLCWPSADIRLIPDYEETVFKGELVARVRVIPGQLLLDTLNFVFSLPVLRATGRLIKAKWRTKREPQKSR